MQLRNKRRTAHAPANEGHTVSRERVPTCTLGPHFPLKPAEEECHASMMELESLDKFEYAVSLCCMYAALNFLL